ncbi:LacI family DNA-binding transcriptional regulator [Scandinavium sp. V105_16]|uniref:LacI family DNA-binding transcriptional regulator n=1 Tax=Scandinavium lactucae TaxID=3095028 RepID=A0AAJ2VUE1_9ENTR|nr:MULTISPECIES: LacI family DNA-binding transcriptional regulator [unclassified Scandinavium]MDX6021708.1 LacI family DNA-binding transcriptional regulator [Scandinavium sp. V105_16]MDX6031873.1 LacI family DNA-binding transcriptional regulator [Scandinavium sp. V105_12]
MSGKLKMDQIATQTGYSVSTVSRVLSGKSYTSEKARESIVRCARKLGVLDEMATGRLLINGIAVFAPSRTFTARGDIFYQEVTRGIADAIEPHDVYLTFCGLEEQDADIKVFLEKANNKNINAIIIIGTDDSTVFKLATTLNKPCVLINTNDKERLLDAVSPDHRAIGFNAMRYLFEQGHRRVLCLTTLRRETLYARLDGIKEAYRRYHVPFNAQRDVIVTEGFSAEESELALAKWLAETPPDQWPQVIFPGSTNMTLGVQKVLERYGLRVPEDISLITTDFHWRLENELAKPVTSVMVPCRELGVEAVHLLQNRLNRQGTSVLNVLLQGKLQEGGTVSNATRHTGRVAIES